MILLFHTSGEGASVSLPEQHTGGQLLPARTYRADGRFLAIDNDNPHVAAWDAAEILHNPTWRLASAQEQQLYAHGKRTSRQLLEEAAPPSAEKTPVVAAAPQAQPDPVKPAKPAGTYSALRS